VKSSQSLFFYYVRIIIVIEGVIDAVTECIFDLVKDILVEATQMTAVILQIS
jgi:hypothetical protein